MISRIMFDQAQIQKDQSFIVRKNQTYNNNEQCSKKMLKDCVYLIDQGVQVLYTLILLFLLELASHSVPLILYTNKDFAHSPVKVLTINFLSFSLYLNLVYFLLTRVFSLTLPYRLSGRDTSYILTNLTTYLPNRQDHYRIVS